MEVKEAIVWVRNIPKIHLYIGTKEENKGEILFTNGVKDCTEKEYYKDIDSVISLLQRGEALKAENAELKAYKQIVESIGRQVKISKELDTYEYSYLVFIERIIQKYLKEAKQDETDTNR